MDKKYVIQVELTDKGEEWYLDIRQVENQTLTVEETATMLSTALSICVRSSENPEELIKSVMSQLDSEFSKIIFD